MKNVVCYLNDAVRECIIQAEGGWDGWRVPLFAKYSEEKEEIIFSVGDQVSMNTRFPGAFEVWSCECWERYWKEDDAEAWAAECGGKPEQFNCEECFEGEVYNFEDKFANDYEDAVKESIIEHFPMLNIIFE